jgi:integrase
MEAKAKEDKKFTELGLQRLKLRKDGKQYVVWDRGRGSQLGLSVLVSARTKTFRSLFYLHGKATYRALGRVGELSLEDARQMTAEDRGKAKKGIDPRPKMQPKPAHEPEGPATYKQIVERFIAEYAKPRQRTWDQTERILTNYCTVLHDRPFAEITKEDIRKLLRGFIADGKSYKANITKAWLKKLWRWACAEDVVTVPIVDTISLDFERRKRTRYFSEDEIRATWKVADQLSPEEGAFLKLLILLAARKTALAAIRWNQLDSVDNPTLWKTPFELTKSRKTMREERVYLTPLPPLAQRIIKGLPKGESKARLFPSITIGETAAGLPRFQGSQLRDRFIKLGAPSDFQFHAWRHTIATWLETKGHSEWERGLALNHSGGGSVTSGYSHGYPLELKTKLLSKWADHVASLVQPKGAALLR